MFTGLIETVGKVAALRARSAGARLSVKAVFASGPLRLGESVCVDGACLTVARLVGAGFEADLSPETLSRTTARAWRPGRRVNLERALTPQARMGGHFVQGHVDGRGKILAASRRGGQTTLRVAPSEALSRLIAEKGSIAVDGVSLTVSSIGKGWFETVLVPHTLAETNLGDRKRGDLVNLEADLIARYLARLFETAGEASHRRVPTRYVRGAPAQVHNGPLEPQE